MKGRRALKKIMVFGCNGFVGTSLCLRAESLGWEIFGADMANKPAISGMNYVHCDISQRDEVLEAVQSTKPDFVINVAAIADIDFAEANRELAYGVNAAGAENIALACDEIGARYLFFSTDAVFDGVAGGYTENSPKAPLNYYGRTKSEAEEKIRAACKSAVIIRISQVLGFAPVSGNSFLDSLDRKLAAGVRGEFPVSEERTPIDIETLCSCVLELYDAPHTGVIHLGSTDSANRYEITLAAARLLGYPDSLVAAVDGDASASPARAPRHKKGIISVAYAQSILKTPLYDCKRTIERAVKTKQSVSETAVGNARQR